MTYKPREQTELILDKAWEHLSSVDYKVSLRWLFYRLLQDGVFSSKEDYKKFKDGALSKARKLGYKQWRPNTLKDDSRRIIPYGLGPKNFNEYLDSLEVEYDAFQYQQYYVEIWFEAYAMIEQFKHYTQRIPLFPFRGDCSIDAKWNAAVRIHRAAEKYGKPVVILYFGDCDQKGLEIPQNALRDIRAWCPSHFTFINCGLTQEDAMAYNLPENPDKPGEYQWEALSDRHAEQIITRNVSYYQSAEGLARLERAEKVGNRKIQNMMRRN